MYTKKGNMNNGHKKKDKEEKGRDNGEGHLRESALSGLATLFPTAQIHNVDVSNSIATRSLTSGGGFKRLGRTTVQAYITSQFCLIPSGDTPITRRLFEALGAGDVTLFVSFHFISFLFLACSDSHAWTIYADD
jgi:hypothetical protein